MKKGLKYTMAAAAGAGAVMLLSKKTKENEHKQKEISKKREDERKDYRNTERGKYERTAKVFITATVTTKLLQDRKNRKVSMAKMLTLSEADWHLWQQPAFW